MHLRDRVFIFLRHAYPSICWHLLRPSWPPYEQASPDDLTARQSAYSKQFEVSDPQCHVLLGRVQPCALRACHRFSFPMFLQRSHRGGQGGGVSCGNNLIVVAVRSGAGDWFDSSIGAVLRWIAIVVLISAPIFANLTLDYGNKGRRRRAKGEGAMETWRHWVITTAHGVGCGVVGGLPLWS